MSKRIKINSKLKAENAEVILIDNRITTKADGQKCYFSDMINFDLPKENEAIHYVTNRAFNAVEIIEKICKSEIIENGAIAVYSISEKAVKKIIELNKSKRLNNLSFLFSTIRNANGAKEKQYNIIEQSGKFKIGYFYSHAKIMALQTRGGNYVVEMSCNLAHNSKVEHITIFNDKKLLDFHCNTINNIINLKHE